MAIGQIGPPTGPKPLYRSNPNSPQFITFGGIHQGRKLIISRSKCTAHKRSIYPVSVFLLFLFYFVRFLAQRPAKTARPILTIYTSNDAVSRKEVPFGGRNACTTFQGSHFPPKHPKYEPPMGISSLNKSMNNFWTVHAISAQISSIGAAWRKKFKTLNDITQNSF